MFILFACQSFIAELKMMVNEESSGSIDIDFLLK